jgi:hypothetical protein
MSSDDSLPSGSVPGSGEDSGTKVCLIPESFSNSFDEFESAREKMLADYAETIFEGISGQEDNAVRWNLWKSTLEKYGRRALMPAEIPEVVLVYRGTGAVQTPADKFSTACAMSGELDVFSGFFLFCCFLFVLGS